MSLAIDVDLVIEVLLNDGWHKVSRGEDGLSSFDLDAYEYIYRRGDKKDPLLLLAGGSEDTVPATGFSFREGNQRICGPVTAIQAVRIGRLAKRSSKPSV